MFTARYMLPVWGTSKIYILFIIVICWNLIYCLSFKYSLWYWQVFVISSFVDLDGVFIFFFFLFAFSFFIHWYVKHEIWYSSILVGRDVWNRWYIFNIFLVSISFILLHAYSINTWVLVLLFIVYLEIICKSRRWLIKHLILWLFNIIY